jgi:hypothetical protein
MESRGIALLIRDLGWVGGQQHAPAALPQERTGTHCTGGWVGPRAGLNVCEKFRPRRDFFKTRSPDPPARSQSLYRLSYPGTLLTLVQTQIHIPIY